MDLPSGAKPELSPWSPTREIVRYVLEEPGYTTNQLKAVQDLVIDRSLKQVPGVIGLAMAELLLDHVHRHRLPSPVQHDKPGLLPVRADGGHLRLLLLRRPDDLHHPGPGALLVVLPQKEG